jgi:hypothetical protein
MSAGNDNLTPDSPNHAEALSLLTDLMQLLGNAPSKAWSGMMRQERGSTTLRSGLQNVRG